MAFTSHFRQLANLITVEDICSSFLTRITGNRSIAEVNDEWSIELCMEQNLDPLDQVVLVEEEGKIQGWLSFDMLEAKKTVFECMEQVEPNMILTADTSLFDAAASFNDSSYPFFFILKGNNLIGWLSYRDMRKPPLRLCLFSMIIFIEGLLLDIALLSARESVGLLSEGRLKKAKKIYDLRRYDYDQEGKPYSSKILECTTISDKISIVKNSTKIKQAVPTLSDDKFCLDLERLRNEIAHPGLEENSSSLLKREGLWQFIKCAETLESELEEFSNQAKMISRSKT